MMYFDCLPLVNLPYSSTSDDDDEDTSSTWRCSDISEDNETSPSLSRTLSNYTDPSTIEGDDTVSNYTEQSTSEDKSSYTEEFTSENEDSITISSTSSNYSDEDTASSSSEYNEYTELHKLHNKGYITWETFETMFDKLGDSIPDKENNPYSTLMELLVCGEICMEEFILILDILYKGKYRASCL